MALLPSAALALAIAVPAFAQTCFVSGVTATTGAPCAIIVSWQGAHTPGGYFDVSVNGTGGYWALANSFTFIGLQPFTTYYFSVTAHGANCNYGPVGNVAGWNSGSPSAATSVSASDGTNCAGVVVSHLASPGAQTFDILRNTTSNSATATVIASSQPCYPPYAPDVLDTTALPGVVYYYWVRSAAYCGNAPLSAPNPGHRALPLAITSAPQSATVYAGTSARTFSASATGGSVSYQWNVGGSPVPGATGPMFTVSPLSASSGLSVSCTVSDACTSLTTMAATLVIRSRITAVTPAFVPPLAATDPPVVLTIDGTGFTPQSQVFAGATPLPTMRLTGALLTATLAPTVPAAGATGALVLSVSDGGAAISNSVALPVGATPGQLSNGGAVTRQPLVVTPGDFVTLGIDGGAPGQELTLVVDLAPVGASVQSFGPGTDLLVGVNLTTAFALFDGLGLYGPPVATTLGSDPLGTPPYGAMRFINCVHLPNPALGIPVAVQAVYFDPTSPAGFRATWSRLFTDV